MLYKNPHAQVNSTKEGSGKKLEEGQLGEVMKQMNERVATVVKEDEDKEEDIFDINSDEEKKMDVLEMDPDYFSLAVFAFFISEDEIKHD